jgi:signal transduction histidine kinase/CheY-like chemotaxis protein
VNLPSAPPAASASPAAASATPTASASESASVNGTDDTVSASAAVRKLRLRTLLTVPFIGLVMVPAIVIAGSSLYAGLNAVDVLSKQLIEDISSRVEQAAVHQLEEAAVTLRAAHPNQSDTYDGSLQTFTDREQLEKKLFELTAQTRTTGYFFYGGEDGTFIGVDRGRPGARPAATIRVQNRPGLPREIYSASQPLDRTRLLETEKRVYEARSRPWYVSAKAERRLTWTPIYVSFASGALVTTASQPVSSRDGKLLGVLAADVELSELSTFMKSVTVSASGVAYIVDREGFLVATSTAEQPFKMVGNEQSRIRAASSESELLRVSANWLGAQRSARDDAAVTPTNPLGMPASQLLDTSLGAIDVASRRVSRIEGTDWEVVVAAPRSDFTAAIVKSAVITFLVTLSALASALLLGLWVLRRVTHDVELLEKSARSVTVNELPETIPEMRLRETGVLAEAFRAMVGRVRKSLDTIRAQNDELATLNSQLEQRVTRRTDELNKRNELLSEEIALRLRYEDELRRASKESVKAADDKARFLAMLSHELRTPLQAVVGSGQLLTARLTEHPPELATMQMGAKSLLSLIDGVLSFSRLEAGRVVPELKRFVVADCIGDARTLVKASRTDIDVPISVTIDSDVPKSIVSDESMVRQVLVNLLHNALKYCQGKPVDVHVSIDRTSLANAESNTGVLRFAVVDQGVGISLEDQETLFRPFQQINQQGADPSRGSGLGLAICELMVSELGGEMSLVSERGQGSTFAFTLPFTQADVAIATDEHASAPAKPLPSGGTIAKWRVLLVEDHAINRELMTRLLQRLGQSVTAVDSGEAALEQLREHPFDLALLDLNLPGISGFETAQHMMEMASGAEKSGKKIELPTLCILTASDDPQDRIRAKQAGIDHFLLKPVTLQSLEALLSTLGNRDDQPKTIDSASALQSLADLQAHTMLDEGVLQSLLTAERASAEPFLHALLLQFGDSVDTELTAITAALVNQDQTKVRALTHAMAGAAVSVGAAGLNVRISEFRRTMSLDDLQRLRLSAAATVEALAQWARVHLAH